MSRKLKSKPQLQARKHIALVGATGVGKSTLVNVLAGSKLAKVSNNAEPCTLQPCRYDIQVDEDGDKYALWDTRGLNEAWDREAMASISRFLTLLRVLPDADQRLRQFLRGKDPKINLILFCIDAKDIRVSAKWKNYNKIYNTFCKGKIKVAVVVTRMDEDTRSTDWRGTCEGMVTKAVGESLDARTIEAVPIFDELDETSDCRRKILTLITSFS